MNAFGKKCRKKKIGWFSFTCCEDNSIVFSEILNDFFWQLKEKVEILNMRMLKKGQALKNMDIAFVEGAIASKRQEEKLRKIRNKSKILIAVGSCATTGMPSGLRNLFNKESLDEILPILTKFSYKKRVEKVEAIVKVDDKISGCPMKEEDFLNVLKKYLA